MYELSERGDTMSDLVFTWENVCLYAVSSKKNLLGKKTISRLKLLHNVSGLAKAGTLCAIMGPSGSGKTTLLAALSQRSTGILQGDIELNGRPIDKNLMIRMSGFVPQQDLSFKTLTVNEHLHFMASLRMDQRVSQLQIKRIIESLCNELNLLNCRRTRLGQLSGGEMKRVSLAVQMLPDPPVLLCDEPTTGLDSFSASQVVTLLRSFAAKGKVVIASIHQPASGIFEMFDKVCLLVPGGKQAYFGDVDEAKAHFAQLGYICPQEFNSAEYFLTQMSNHPDRLCQKFEDSKHYRTLLKEIAALKSTSRQCTLIYGMDESFLKFYSIQTASTITQMKWLIWRSALDLYRNMQKFMFKMSIYVLTALLISLPYTRTRLDQEGIQNIQGRNYSVVTETIFTQAYAVMNTFPAEIPVLLREIGNGLYKPAPYYLSKLFILLPKAILETILFSSIIYWVAGGSGDAGFFSFVFPIVVCAVASSAYGCCISAMFENTRTASLLAVPFDFVSYTFSGLFLQLSSVPLYLSWIKYLSRFYYGLEAMTILQWRDISSIPCPENKELPCIEDGYKVMYNYGYHPNNLLLDLSGLMIMFFVLNIVGYIFFARRSRKSSTY
uniref:Protein scarlet n=2 Tax=Lygus hesperus TaxID=30085 RepID=A0A0A9Y0I9_LYGHE